jgi:hypothetical protein
MAPACCPWCNGDYVDGRPACDCAEVEERASRRRARFLPAVARLGRLHAQRGVFAEPTHVTMYGVHREAYRRAWVAARRAA